MRRQTVLLDCDQVLSDFIGGWLTLINGKLGTKHKPEHVTDWDILESLKLKKRSEELYALMQKPGFCLDLPVLPGAKEAVAALQDVADVYIVTAPMSSVRDWTHQREAWLRKHFGIKSSQVFHTSAKHLIRGDIFVDDKFDNCVAWNQKNWTAFTLLWDAPHNQGKGATEGLENEGIIRVKDWKTVMEAVRFYE